MSACEECLAASSARAGVVEALESRGFAVSAAGAMLGLGPFQAAERLGAQGTPVSSPEAELPAGTWTLCGHCSEFPVGLTRFERASDIPHVIYGVGSMEQLLALQRQAAVAIVGARRATAYGREVAWQLAADLAAGGTTVISGMALGIDGAAHRGALSRRGSTIAVLAGGPDRAYPRSHRLLHEQICDSGCVISESPPGTQARRWAFVARNRLIAALSNLTVFVEGQESSGARHTVDFATDLGVAVGAVPGPVTNPMSSGPNALLAEGVGVEVIRSADDVRNLLGIALAPQQPLAGLELAGDQQRVFDALGSGARTPDQLARELPDLDSRGIARMLGALELAGHVERTRAGDYQRKLG